MQVLFSKKNNHLNPFLLQQTDHITLDSPWASVMKMKFQAQVSCKLCQDPKCTPTPTFINLTVFQNQFSEPYSTCKHTYLTQKIQFFPPNKSPVMSKLKRDVVKKNECCGLPNIFPMHNRTSELVLLVQDLVLILILYVNR